MLDLEYGREQGRRGGGLRSESRRSRSDGGIPVPERAKVSGWKPLFCAVVVVHGATAGFLMFLFLLWEAALAWMCNRLVGLAREKGREME
jgi:hypothetical protein